MKPTPQIGKSQAKAGAMSELELDTIYCGDAEELVGRFASSGPVAHSIITSPPYFGQRVYSEQDPRELGREACVEQYAQRLAQLLTQVGQLLRDDGTLWLNLGDSYRRGVLQGAPWRVALKLQDLGWTLRSDVIWHKPNAMPSAVKTRPTTDHEYLFLFSKCERYYYDADAVREPHVTFTDRSRMRGGRRHFGVRNGTPEAGKLGGRINMHDGRWDQAFHPKGRNRRTVWSVPLGKCREAHFAVFPAALIEPCMVASVPEGGVALDPFMGAGTTACVARATGRHYIGFELVAEYVQLAQHRIEQAAEGATPRRSSQSRDAEQGVRPKGS